MEDMIKMTSSYLNASGNIKQYVGDLTVYPAMGTPEISEAIRHERQLMVHMKSYVDGNLSDLWTRVKYVWEAVTQFNRQIVEAHDNTAKAVRYLVNVCNGIHHGLQILLMQDLPSYIDRLEDGMKTIATAATERLQLLQHQCSESIMKLSNEST